MNRPGPKLNAVWLAKLKSSKAPVEKSLAKPTFELAVHEFKTGPDDVVPVLAVASAPAAPAPAPALAPASCDPVHWRITCSAAKNCAAKPNRCRVTGKA